MTPTSAPRFVLLASAKAAGARVAHVLAISRPSATTDDGMGCLSDKCEFVEAVTAVAPLGVIIRLPVLHLTWRGLDTTGSIPPCALAELAVKLVLNAITTGAHVKRGVIHANRMINVGVTNAKLFHRAVSIIRSVTSSTESASLTAMLRAIYHVDDDSESAAFPAGASSLAALCALPVSAHVRAAAVQVDLVPVAVLLAAAENRSATTTLTERAAVALLRADPLVRNALQFALT